MRKTIVAIFPSRNSAEEAAKQIRDNGLRIEDISIIRLSETQEGQQETASTTQNDNVSNGTLSGAAIGGTGGLLLGLGTFAIPGLGVLTAAGPVTGLITGGISGGVIGMLADLGVSPQHGSEYEEIIRQGRVYFSMPINEDTGGRVSKILKSCGAEKVTVHKKENGM